MRRIILIGYMGVGKTTVGKVLSRKLGLDFYDLDQYIENRFHQKIPEIFATKGETGFRELEQRMLHEVCEFEDVLLSCGGGTPCFFDNMDYMNRQGLTIYLKSTPDILAAHLSMSKNPRPLIKGKSPEELHTYIKESLEKREPFYSQAHYTYDIPLLSQQRNVDKVADSLYAYINSQITENN